MSALKLKKIVLSIMALASFMGCDRQSKVILNDVESYIESRPDSALTVLRALVPESMRSREMRAQYSLLYAKALDKNYIDTTDASVIQPALDWYKHHGSVENKAKSLYYYGRILQNAHDHAVASVVFSDVERMLDKVDDIKFHGLVYSALSYSYLQTLDFDENLNYQLKAYKVFQEVGSDYQKEYAKYELANAYAASSQLEQADSLYKAMIVSPTFPETLLNKTKCNYAYMMMSQTDGYDKAYEIYESVITSQGYLNTPGDYSAYAFLMALHGFESEADEILTQVEESDPMRVSYWRNRIRMLHGDYESAYNDLNGSLIQRDSLVYQSLKQSVAKAQRDYYRENQLRESIQKRNIMLALSCLILLLIIVVLLLTIINSKMKREHQNLVVLSESVKEQLNLATDNFRQEREKLRTEYFKRNQKQFSDIGRLCDVVLKAERSPSSLKYKNLYSAIRKKVNSIDDGKEGQRFFEQALNDGMGNIMAEFRCDYPNLSDLDYRCVSYFFAGFSTSTICLLLKYPSTSAIYSRRSRIKKIIEESNSPNREVYLGLF